MKDFDIKKIIRVSLGALITLGPIILAIELIDRVSIAFERSGGNEYISNTICFLILCSLTTLTFANTLYLDGLKDGKTYADAWQRVGGAASYLMGYYALCLLVTCAV